ncbi:MAG TPA: hypothetical protein VF789_02330 [Thermoanaerobaculia bacterium]
MRRNLAALSFTVFSLLIAGLAAAQPLTNTLTSEQVTCNELQLAALLSRMSLQGVNDPQNNLSLNLLVTYSNRFGFYEGLAVANQSPFTAANPGGGTRAESFLAFSLNPSIRTTLLNPNRQRLEQVSLVREDTSSNLVNANANNALVVFLNPTLGGNDTSTGRLQINNIGDTTVAQCGLRRGADTKPGRGLTLAGLTTPCHTQFTDFDRLVFEILQRTFRVTSPTTPAQDFEIAIFRGEEQLTYRIDVYPVGTNGAATNGKVALELALTTDGSGAITGGTLSILPNCSSSLQLGCTTSTVALNVFLVPPVFGGTGIRLTSDIGAQLTFQPGAATPSPATVDFGQILEGTPWLGSL